jgi:hypothetical protein
MNIQRFCYFLEIESTFVPWLMDAVENRIHRTELARRLLDGLLMNERP